MLVRLSKLWTVCGIFLSVFAPTGIAGAASEDNSPSALQILEGHEGHWTVTGRRLDPDGWTDIAPQMAEIENVYGGRAYVETTQIDYGSNQSGLQTTLTWDGFREVYRISALDEGFGLLDVYEGRLDSDGRLVATNLRSDTYFEFGEDTRLHFQLRWTFVSDDQFMFDVLMTTDGGASWTPYFELEYRRAD
ncbi:MAG: hypothetical protein DHS20C06_03840 [Hyphobacterium sp.]|nr:MAG: hypothetical protein DHS20C06_03840 [Hyphobacterium sp.]